jgi:hypothetical protein
LPACVSAAGFYFTAEKPFGYSWYDLETTVPDSGLAGPGRATIRSRLDFPLDPFRFALGWSGAGEIGNGNADVLGASAEAWASLGPGFFRMRDQDWAGENNSGNGGSATILMKISDTYSTAEAILFGGEAACEPASFTFLGEPFAFGLGAGGSRYAYRIYGLEGNQLSGQENGWTPVSAPDDLLVGTYATWTLRSLLSLRTRERLLGLEWKARFVPLSYSGSVDDHVLRKKRIEMDCLGTGGSLEAGRRPAGSHWMPYARIELERAWGRMKQTYYADSPDTPQDETGQSLSGIHTTVNTWAVTIGVRWIWP